jgi:hypothetical protein
MAIRYRVVGTNLPRDLQTQVGGEEKIASRLKMNERVIAIVLLRGDSVNPKIGGSISHTHSVKSEIGCQSDPVLAAYF